MSFFNKKNYCDDCEFSDQCEFAGEIESCEDCEYYVGSPCKSMCMAGEDIACDNGFSSLYEDEDDELYLDFIMTDDGLVPLNDDKEDENV